MNHKLKNLDPETLAILRQLVLSKNRKKRAGVDKGVNVYIREHVIDKRKSGSARCYSCQIPYVYHLIERQMLRCATVREIIEILTFIGLKPSKVKI